MCLCLLRRSFLKSSLTASALAACDGEPKTKLIAADPSADATSRRWLDVHCHIFNAQDVPLYEFIKRTRLTGIRGVAAPLLAIATGGLKHDALSATDELKRLRSGAAPRLFEAVPSGRAAATGDDVLEGLVQMRDRTAPAPALGRSAGLLPARGSNAAPTGREALELFDAAFREQGIRTGRRRAGVPPPPSDRELRRFANLLEPARGRSFGGTLARYFAWGRMFSEDRNGLLSRLAALYPGQELMLTPALVDYDKWLDAPDNALPAQFDVAEAITVRRAQEGLPVHAFLAFDPWRCLEARAEGTDTLEDLKTRLRRGAGIGVKLYPPMGFSAADNAGRAAETYPKALQQLTRGRSGPELDAVLDDLFDFLADNQIPIMAHCGQTNGSRKEYESLAGPQHWKLALDRDRPRRRELRLNLGHFGGIWELGAADRKQREWAAQVAELVSHYPNVYADIAYFGSVLDGQVEKLRQSGQFIADLAARPGSLLPKKLMYGSDWSMLGQEEGPERYPAGAVAALQATWGGSREDDLRWRNAARFLGLGTGDATRERLLAFYRANGAAPAPLLRFDPASA